MTRYKIGLSVISLVAIFVICGCAVRTYKVTKARVDQKVAGNQGYLSGNVPAGEVKPASTTRDTYVMEVELGSSARYQKLSQPKMSEQTIAPIEKTNLEEDYLTEEETAIETSTLKTYKVMSGDTLQKISKQFYGTYKKWQKIYEANRDRLTNPNKIKPGTTINIPE